MFKCDFAYESEKRVELNKKQDVGGQDRLRPLWRQYYSGTHGIMFVVDTNDTAIERIV